MKVCVKGCLQELEHFPCGFIIITKGNVSHGARVKAPLLRALTKLGIGGTSL